MIDLEIKNPLVISRVKAIKIQAQFMLEKLNLNDSKLTILAYYFLYPKTALDQMVKDKVFSSTQSARNLLPELRRAKLLLGTRNKTHINPKLKFYLGDFRLILNVQTDAEDTVLDSNQLSRV